MLTLFAYLRAFLSYSPSPWSGDPRPAPAGRRAQAQHPRPPAQQSRPPVLAGSAAPLVAVGDALVLVKPETVVGWHRAGFRLYWRLRSARRRAQDRRRRVRDRPADGAGEPLLGRSRIHGELLKLGFEISERTVSATWLAGCRKMATAAKNWLAFLKTIARRSLRWTSSPCPPSPSGCSTASFAIDHARRKILHFT